MTTDGKLLKSPDAVPKFAALIEGLADRMAGGKAREPSPADRAEFYAWLWRDLRTGADKGPGSEVNRVVSGDMVGGLPSSTFRQVI